MKSAFLLSVLFLAACASSPKLTTAFEVSAFTEDGHVYHGTGALIGHTPEGDYVLTAGHLAKKNAERFEVAGHRAELVKSMVGDSPMGYTDLALLFVPGKKFTNSIHPLDDLQNTFDLEMHTRVTVKTVTVHDGSLWSEPWVQPGDSGSPLINKEGRTVGILWGYSESTDGTQTVRFNSAPVIRLFLKP